MTIRSNLKRGDIVEVTGRESKTEWNGVFRKAVIEIYLVFVSPSSFSV